jgi:hypothetical protein
MCPAAVRQTRRPETARITEASIVAMAGMLPRNEKLASCLKETHKRGFFQIHYKRNLKQSLAATRRLVGSNSSVLLRGE